ncbi:MAG: hypothetical protein BWK79_18055, partial [Beggiatoa sp. IS2]
MTLSTKWFIVLGLFIFPIFLLLLLGLLWLWQQDLLLQWLGISIIFSMLGFLGGYALRRSQIIVLPDLPTVKPHDHWSEQGKAAWQWVENTALAIKIEDYPLNDHHKLLSLGQTIVEKIALHYHPASDNSVWEIPVPYLLKITELVSADLRTNFVAHIPASHIVTINDLIRGQRLTSVAR